MSTFDPEGFLNTEYAESTSTTIIPVPEGEFIAQVSDVKAKQIQVNGEDRVVMDIIWEVLDDGVKAELEMDKVTVRQGLFLDLTEEGAIDMRKGKNRQLGLIREATGQNKDGKPWAPGKLIGETATIAVTQRPDKNDPDNIFNDVKKVTKG